MKPQCGGKPVIYLFSSASIQASVRLSLVKEWAFSAIYPVVPIKTYPPVGQTLEWHVQTHPDGTLTEHSTNLRTSYLFWEAEYSDRHRPLSPPPSPSAGPVFNPVHSTVSDADSVVLPVTQITPYLDAALTALSLHVEARTSFITYWLPSILKHTHIALRFVPQAAYEKAAPLEVTPQPDVLTRIFMLWKGVTSAELRSGVWQNSVQRASMDVEMWKGIVGIQEFPSMYDESAFRVLEWGGMEVHKS
ncbi:hypothetical protein BDZ89DRAFT_957527 [Hymenopellis radicata]|nr:hypothetical protein BDZ89DRAFT_957527 [Hymenopellis radicata]